MKSLKTFNGRPLGVTVELVGGLGNQLFIYSAGFDLAQKLECPLFLDTTWFQGNVNRVFGLNSFRHSGCTTHSSSKYTAMIRRLRNISIVPMTVGRGTFIESSLSFHPEVGELPVGSRLRGYFQSWKYFQSSTEVLREQMRILTEPSIWFSRKNELWRDEDPWIAIHVRRGDYLAPGALSVHGILGSEYYKRALENLDSSLGKYPLKIFSDDPGLSRNLFRGCNRTIEFIEPPVGSNPMESVLLMSLGSAIIAANSTFSWWGAWLGDSQRRPVIVPDPWFIGMEYEPDDLFLKSWIRLDSNLAKDFRGA